MDNLTDYNVTSLPLSSAACLVYNIHELCQTAHDTDNLREVAALLVYFETLCKLLILQVHQQMTHTCLSIYEGHKQV